MNRHRRYSKRELLGKLEINFVLSADQLSGISATCSRWIILEAFLQLAEARAERLIETEGGFVLLASVHRQRNSGAVYVYNAALRAFFLMGFDRDSDLNGSDFDQAVWAYKLLRYTQPPTTPFERPTPAQQSLNPALVPFAANQRPSLIH